MKVINKKINNNDDHSILEHHPQKQIPVVYNVSSTDYCGLRLKKKFVQRYMISKQWTQFCSKYRNENKLQKISKNINSNIAISPIKINENSPELIKGRLKTSYSKQKKYKYQRQKNINVSTVKNSSNITFLQSKNVFVQARKDSVKNSKVVYSNIGFPNKERPLTANNNISIQQINGTPLRRTKTFDVSKSVGSRKDGKLQRSYILKGWQNQIEYD